MMFKKNQLTDLFTAGFEKVHAMLVFVFFIVCLSAGLSVEASTTTMAGVIIRSQATAEYVPNGYSAKEVIYSNTVLAEVLPVEDLTLTTDMRLNSVSGAPVVIPHVLTNVGNIRSSYTLSLSNLGSDDFDVSALRVFWDSNGNGITDVNEPEVAIYKPSANIDSKITLDKAGEITLKPGESANLLIKGLIPINANNYANLKLIATSNSPVPITKSNTDIITITQGAVVPLVKSASQTGFVAAGAKIDYTLVATNIGNGTANPTPSLVTIDGITKSVFLIRDSIPLHTKYVSCSLSTRAPNIDCSLNNEIAGWKLLYHSRGAGQFIYQTSKSFDNSDLVDEVAVAIESDYMRPNVTSQMTFSVIVDDNYSGSISNTGSVCFDNATSVCHESNQVILNTAAASIGIAKRAGLPVRNSNDIYTVPLSFVVKNYGAVPLYDIQLNDLLEDEVSNLHFGAYTSNSIPDKGKYTIVAGSGIITSVTDAVSVAYNNAFTGRSSAQNLLAPHAVLPINGEFKVEFKILINPDSSRFVTINHPLPQRNGVIKVVQEQQLTIQNSATVDAAKQPQGSLTVHDKSTDGINPDTNNDGNPIEDTPTPIIADSFPPPPYLTVEKTVAKPRKISRDTYELDYAVKITNVTTIEDTFVRLSDNLDCTFQMDTTNGPVKSWSLVGAPTTDNGLLVSAGSTFTGHISGASGVNLCDRNKLALDVTVHPEAYPSEQSLNLLDGKHSLFPGEQETIRFTVRIVRNLSYRETVFENRAYAAVFDTNTINGATLVVAASDSAALVIDPSGIVYDSVTRNPVDGATVTLRQIGACPVQLKVDQLLETSHAYTQVSADSISMITGELGRNPAAKYKGTTITPGEYQFFISGNLANVACNYLITAADATGYVFQSWFKPLSGNAPSGFVGPVTVPVKGIELNTITAPYYLNFLIGNTFLDVINNHIPLDPPVNASTGQLFLQKIASKSVVELGDTVLYTLTMKNLSIDTFNTAVVKDALPRGFSYVSGSTRLGTQSLPDPAGVPGSSLQFNLSGLTWDNQTPLTLSYLLRVGVGASLERSSINRAQVFTGPLSSNPSSASVQVTGGVFSDEAYLIGKVYLENCKADKVQNNEKDNKEEEVGIPGVRLLMEDGTSVITDIEGKYSLYGLSPITHVLKLDKSTLPQGARLIVLNNRNSGKGDSRFIDLKKGELHKADFAVSSCDAEAVVQDVMQRRKALDQKPDSEGEAVIRRKLDASFVDAPVSDVRARPASGVLTPSGMQSSAANSNNTNAAFQGVQPTDPATALAVQRLNESLASRPSVIPLEEVIKVLDNQTGFIELKEGDTLPTDVTNVRVKGMLDATLRLSVNGVIEPVQRVGKKSKIIDKRLEAWEYIGVKLKAGSNTLLLEVVDSFNNVRETKIITVIAPGQAGRVEIQAPETATADSKTPVNIKIRLLDDNGVPVTTRTQLTLEANEGRWENKDLNPDEPGMQAFMEGGEAEFKLIPPGVPKDGIVRVNVGILQRETKISFLPEMRSLVGVGLIEGVLDLSKAGKVNVNAPNAGDAFERELRNLSISGKNLRATGRAAFYFKGTIQGEYLLTTAYDSDKDTKQRLFRDIQPEKFYPIYGDSSIKGFDAQSTQRFYLRVDNKKSYLLYGDFTTAENNPARKLSQYSRSVTGVKTHYENGDFSATAFASRDSLSQGILEMPANGTSGPYKLNKDVNQSLSENSEKIEILVRDKNQPSIILETVPLTRFSDYAIDPIAGEIFFKGPVASVDANLNPRTIRVTYEVQKGGKQFWMVGGDARLKVTDYLELGASYARDDNPQKKSQIMGATAVVKLDDKTTLTGEVARTQTSPDTTGLTGNAGFGYVNQYSPSLSGTGLAERLQLRHSGDDLKLDVQFTHASKGFNNPTAGIGSGRTEATTNINYKVADGSNLKGQGIYSKDNTTGGVRVGGALSIDHAFDEYIKGEIGLRAAHETSLAAQPTSVGTTPNDILSIRARLTGKLPWINGADVYGEAEQNALNLNQRMLAVGAGYLLNAKTRLYGRYQFISSIGNSSYGLNSSQQNNTAVIGVESAYMTDGRLFSEYRIKDAINGRESQAAMGLRQTWTIADGFKLGGSFEMTHAFAGFSGSESKAVTALAEYTTDPSYKLTSSAEARFASTGNSYSNTVALAYKIDDDWSALARHSLSIQGTRSDRSTLWRTRQQIGVAWRQVTENRWNALGRYEHRLEFKKGGIDPYSTESHIVSTHVNYQPHRDVITSGRYALKWTDETYNNLSTSFLGHLLYGRVTWDFLPDWDASLQGGLMADKLSIQYAGGVELGYQVKNDLWVSAGYNLIGFNGRQLQGTDYTSQGFYVRMRFKFDEGLFE